MTPLITWTLAGGTVVFAIGLVSAISARNERRLIRQDQSIKVPRSTQGQTATVPTPAEDTIAIGKKKLSMAASANHPDLSAYEQQAQDIKELRQDLLDATNILISCGANRQDIARYQALLDRTKPTSQE